MKAVVMAGGEGTRLRPLTSNRPKPLVPILNKPCMQHSIELLKRYGVDEIIVTLYYLADEIQGYFGDGADLGVKLHYTIEDTPLGTAGSVRQAYDILKDDTFIIVSGDALTDINVEKALEFHKRKGSMATLVLQHVENPLEFGVVITDEEGRVRRFLEKPSWGEVFSDTVNTGMYIIEPEVLEYMEDGISYDWSQASSAKKSRCSATSWKSIGLMSAPSSNTAKRSTKCFRARRRCLSKATSKARIFMSVKTPK